MVPPGWLGGYLPLSKIAGRDLDRVSKL